MNLAGRQACPRRRCSAEGPLGAMPPGHFTILDKANWKAPQRIGGRCDSHFAGRPKRGRDRCLEAWRSGVVQGQRPVRRPTEHDRSDRGRKLMRPYIAVPVARLRPFEAIGCEQAHGSLS